MASDDRVEVRLHSRRADRGRAAWNGFVHAVCFVLGVWAFMVAVVSAIDLGNENHRKSSLSGGLLVVGAVVAYVAFKQVLKPTCEFRGGGRGSREGSDGPFNPFTCHLEITESEIEAMAAGTGQPVEVLASRLTSLSPALARKLVEGSQPLGLDLNGLRSLSKETAEVLAQYDGPLSLKGLRTISEEVAEALSHHHGWLSLSMD